MRILIEVMEIVGHSTYCKDNMVFFDLYHASLISSDILHGLIENNTLIKI